MAGEKKITGNTFEGGRNTDIADELLPQNQFRYANNVRIYGLGTKGVASNITGNILVDAMLPAGDNIAIGRKADEENNCFYYCVWNSNGFHTIYKYNSISKTVLIVLQSKTDTNGIDILRWSKDKKYRIHHIDVVQNNLIYFVDALNKARKFNINKAMDKSTAGYGLTVQEDFITAYKQTFPYAPQCAYVTDPSRNSNNLYGNLFKFTAYPQYDDGELGNWCDWSVVPKPPNQSYTGLNTITFDNNCIEVKVGTGNRLVKKIVIAVKVNNTSAVGNDILDTDFVICAILDKVELNIPDNSTYTYKFYNDGSYSETNQDKINRVYSFMQRIPKCQAFVKSAMTYTGGKEGWEVVLPKMTVGIRLDDLYLPDNAENKQTNASIIANEVNVEKDDPLFGGYRYNNTTRFIIGVEVKKGNKFEIFGRNSTRKSSDLDNYYFSYTANGSDTASTVASFFKSALRSIGRPTEETEGTGGITNENIDGSGNVSFDYSYLGKWNASKTSWTTNTTQVSYLSLKDNGLSVQIIPYGSVTNYGVVYIDDDGRESLAYTNSVAVIRTPYITEIGSYKLPVHIVTLSHTPPIDAKYWRLVRTPQPHGLEIMIQKVINVTTDNTSEYLDLVVGSLLTYQKLHKNTILQYQFEAGDRIRFIKNVEDGTFYNGFIETEVLGYTLDQEETITSNIVVYQTDEVKPDKPVDATLVGKSIIVNGIEREIISVTGDNRYKLDSPLKFADTEQTFPSFIIVDRRGIIRIKKPAGVTVANNSLVELFKPQTNDISTDYKIFRDFGQKYEISNYGTDARAHRGNVQNQTTSQPAIIEISKGDAYIRDRELPANNVVPGTQVMISKVVDRNFSDFYTSDLTDLGRAYPQDDGKGVVDFGSRTRYSGNYIEDTGINGLNDFDNLDRVDNNDSYGDIMLTKFFANRIYVFKPLKDAFIPVLNTLTSDSSGTVLNVQNGKLLNQMQYFAFEGGIGNNPESWFYNGNFQYHASTNAGCFLRVGGEGLEPISTLYDFDKEARRILGIVEKYDLLLYGEYDRLHDEAIWTMPQYTQFLYNGAFDYGAWRTDDVLLPAGLDYEVVQQPVNGDVTYDSTLKSFVVTNTIPGNDFFTYRPILGDGSFGAVKKQCILTVLPDQRDVSWRSSLQTSYCVQRAIQWRAKVNTAYCVQNTDIPLGDFDFAVLRPVWEAGSGNDLDTFTYLVGTGTPLDGDPDENSRVNRVGFNQNPAEGSANGTPPDNRLIPRLSANPILNWATDNTGGAGVEAILIDFKQFIIDYPDAPNITIVEQALVWYGTRGTGDVSVTLTTYKGGTMTFNAGTKDFDNTGGVLVNEIEIPVNVVNVSASSLLVNAQKIARVSYNKTTATANLTLL